jgi:hypothetical protein
MRQKCESNEITLTTNYQDILKAMSFNEDPKDPKKSIRLKYNRRRENLRHTLDQFIMFAEDRIDEEKYGTVYKKDEVISLIKGARELLEKFPPKKEVDFTAEDFASLEAMLENAAEETDKIMNEIANDATDYNELLKEIQAEIQKKQEKEK